LALHPYQKLREVAASAFAKSGTFSPTLKALYYSGTRIENRSFRRDPGDFALALVAVAAVEEEARQKGFKGPQYAAQYAAPGPRFHGPLRFNGDSSSADPRLGADRVGDILAARLQSTNPMEGGINNGVTLLYLVSSQVSARDDLRKDWPASDEAAAKPLSEELKARVLAAWRLQREAVKKPFTQEQLEAEIALARKLRYDDFKVGPYYETLAPLIDEGRQRNFNASQEQDVWNKKLLAFPDEAAPDLLRILKWREIASPPKSVLRFLARWVEAQSVKAKAYGAKADGAKANATQSSDSKAGNTVKAGNTKAGDARWDESQVFPLLAQIAYGQGWPDGDARIEAIRLMAALDFERAKPHLENFLSLPYEPGDWSREAPRMGAAIALAASGDKRGVPIIFSAEYERRFTFLDSQTVSAALKIATGQDFPNLVQWQRWWKGEGQNMEWK
jgi:hypothetical protein